MTDTIEQKALALVREVAGYEIDSVFHDAAFADVVEAVHRAIEQHEAFRQEVSDAVGACRAMWPESWELFHGKLDRFIIAKPDTDPLADVVSSMWVIDQKWAAVVANNFRAAIEKRGGKIVWGEG